MIYTVLRGETQRALNEIRRGINLVSTRSFVSPYLIMMIIYIKLLKGESNTLVLSAEAYLSKRKHRNARKNDPFIYLKS